MRISELVEFLPHITASGSLDSDTLRGVVQQRDAELKQRRAEQRKAEMLKQQQRHADWLRRHTPKPLPTLKPKRSSKRRKRRSRFVREMLCVN